MLGRTPTMNKIYSPTPMGKDEGNKKCVCVCVCMCVCVCVCVSVREREREREDSLKLSTPYFLFFLLYVLSTIDCKYFVSKSFIFSSATMTLTLESTIYWREYTSGFLLGGGGGGHSPPLGSWLPPLASRHHLSRKLSL